MPFAWLIANTLNMKGKRMPPENYVPKTTTQLEAEKQADIKRIERDRLTEAKTEALAAIETVVGEFPQLVDGTDGEVNGADLVDAVARAINDSAVLTMYLQSSLKKRG